MMTLLIVLAVMLLIAVTKVGLSVRLDKGLTLYLRIGPFSFSLLREKKQTEKKSSKVATKKKRGSSPWIKVLLQHWRDVLSLISRILRMPRVDQFSLCVLFGGKDQADAALNYGRACAAAGVLLPFLKSLFQIEEKDIQILYDAEASDLTCTGKGTVTVRVYQSVLLALAVIRLAYRLHKELPNSQKVV